MLRIDKINVFYGDVQVLWDVSLRVDEEGDRHRRRTQWFGQVNPPPDDCQPEPSQENRPTDEVFFIEGTGSTVSLLRRR